MDSIDELTAKIVAGEKVTYGEAENILAGHKVLNGDVYNFDNCVLSCNSLDDDAVLYNPIIGGK